MAHTPFTGPIPEHLLYCPRHDMWVEALPDGSFRLGATAFGIFLAGEIIAFTAKPKGAQVDIGRGMGTVECRKTILAVHAPLSFTLREGNEEAEERPALINRDPYQRGWMAHVDATRWPEEKTQLIDAAAYRAHILKLEPEARFV